MIRGTLAKINRNPSKEILSTSAHDAARTPFDAMPVDPGWEIKPIKTLSFDGHATALIRFGEYLNNEKIHPWRHAMALILHATENVTGSKIVDILYESSVGNLTKMTITNPLWAGAKGVRRRVNQFGLEASVSLAMQSQLFAMLDGTAGDSNWLQTFQLKDRQQSKMYQWQAEALPNKNNMSPVEMGDLMKNVLNVARLPWITLNFVEKGKACMFALTRENGKTLSVENQDGEPDSTQWGWLARAGEDRFERVGEINAGYRLRISDMRLVMVMEWAMNAPILLHEIAHYINFMHPTPYRLNRGEFMLNYNQYEELFAGHGATYMAVFARLLIDFHHVKKESLYESLESSGLCWFPIKSIRVEDVTEGITEYCRRWK